jgi:uncharacterized protein YcbK (DUF882 family)
MKLEFFDIGEMRALNAPKSSTITLLVALSFVFTCLFALAAPQYSSANAETRTLKMYYGHSKESATITFKKNGKYIASGLRKANRFLRDWRRKEPTKMDPALLDLVWEVYQKTGSKKPIQVISGYRSPRTNKMLRRRGRKVAKTSQHTRGKALDFFIPGVSVSKLRALGLKAHRGGVGYYRGSFVHLDTGRVRHWPRMSRRQLSRVFPRGKTIHVPSNGKPLRGYKTAAANLKKGLNADGSRRKTTVRKSLLARIFSRSGNDGDEGEGDTRVRKAVAKPAPKKVAPKKVAPPKPKPVAVAAAKPAPAKPTVDPFKKDLSAVKKTRKQQELEAAKAKADQEAKDAAAAAELAEKAKEDAKKDIVLAALAPNRLAVPLRRPAASVSKVVENKLEPISTTEVALAAPAAVTNVLRPSVNVPKKAPAPKEQLVAALSPAKSDELKSRVQTALARQPKPAPAVAAVKQLIAPKSVEPAKPAAPSQDDIAKLALAAGSQLKAAKALQKDNLVKQASLKPVADFKPTTPVWRAPAKPSTKAEKPTLKAKVEKARVPVPKKQDNVAKKATVAAIRTGSRIPMKAELSIGDLDGRSVKVWAVAASTRTGALASLKAPDYKNGAKRAVPAAVYSKGFVNKRFALRSDRFSGRALTRVAFAKLPESN